MHVATGVRRVEVLDQAEVRLRSRAAGRQYLNGDAAPGVIGILGCLRRSGRFTVGRAVWAEQRQTPHRGAGRIGIGPFWDPDSETWCIDDSIARRTEPPSADISAVVRCCVPRSGLSSHERPQHVGRICRGSVGPPLPWSWRIRWSRRRTGERSGRRANILPGGHGAAQEHLRCGRTAFSPPERPS